jgi:predicted nuclease with TOPRIM domain
MTENVESLILEHLRILREGQDRVEREVRELKTRVGSLEEHVALLHADMVGLSKRLDRLDERVERIERRLNLVDA